MARLVAGAAAFGVLCRALPFSSTPPPGEFGHDDSTENLGMDFMNPSKVPGHDKCSVDCYRICQDGLGRKVRNMASNSDCINACYAHVIETPHKKMAFWDNDRQQGKYVQKVMTEYCARGRCRGKDKALLQTSAQTKDVQEHEQKEGEAYSPNTAKGDPRAVYMKNPEDYPSGCMSDEYSCQELCQNMYHKPTSDLGEHFGASEETWSTDQAKCKVDCLANTRGLYRYWDKWCSCFQRPRGDMHLENVPGLLQEDQQEVQNVDVGSFMQTSVEL